MSTIRAVAFGILFVCAAAAVACGGKDTVASARTAILAPAEGDSVSGDSLTVMMSVTGAKIVPVKEATSTKVPLEGHLHLFIDHDVTPPNVTIPMGDAAMVHLGNGATEYIIPKLTPGPHRIILVFAYTDHTPDMAVATDTVNFIVR